MNVIQKSEAIRPCLKNKYCTNKELVQKQGHEAV